MLTQLIGPQNIKASLESADKDEVFAELVELALSIQPGIGRQEAIDALVSREATMSTGIIPGIAAPHGVCASVKGSVVVVGISREGIEYDALDGGLVHFVVMILFEPGDTEAHLQIMKDVASLLQKKDFYSTVMSKETSRDIYDAMKELEQKGENSD